MRPFLAASLSIVCVCLISQNSALVADELHVAVSEDEVEIETALLKAAIRKKGYVSGVAAQSFLDKTTGFHDAGFGLDIVDWIMEPGSDEPYRAMLDKELIYEFGNPWHGSTPKRSIEGPQICTQAKSLSPQVAIRENYIVVDQTFQYQTAAPGKNIGSRWSQRLIFPKDTRYIFTMDRIDAVNTSEAMFLRLDMPGHIKHNRGDTFSQVYLSYYGLIPASEFFENFAPDEKFNYQRQRDGVPERFIRAYQLKNPQTGAAGPWLAGMTLDPESPSEAWCHQRNYVCMIEEFGGRPVQAGESFSAAFIIGYFDSVEEMHAVYDRYKGAVAIGLAEDGSTLELTRSSK